LRHEVKQIINAVRNKTKAIDTSELFGLLIIIIISPKHN
jgi:hypothetical protein